MLLGALGLVLALDRGSAAAQEPLARLTLDEALPREDGRARSSSPARPSRRDSTPSTSGKPSSSGASGQETKGRRGRLSRRWRHQAVRGAGSSGIAGRPYTIGCPAGTRAGFGDIRSDSDFPAKFSRGFPANSHLLDLTGGFWDRIGQVRRPDDLHHEGEPSRFSVIAGHCNNRNRTP
jgi:hypothetical protein